MATKVYNEENMELLNQLSAIQAIQDTNNCQSLSGLESTPTKERGHQKSAFTAIGVLDRSQIALEDHIL